MNKICCFSIKSNDTVRHLPCELNLLTADNILSNFVEEWTLLANNYWSEVSQVKQQSVAWKNCQRARLKIPNHAFFNSQKKWSYRYAPTLILGPKADDKVWVIHECTLL